MGILGTNYKFELFGRLKKKDESSASMPGSGFGGAPQSLPGATGPSPGVQPGAQPVGTQESGANEIDVLVSRIKDMSSQGMPESQIIYTLKKEGYSFSQIDEALNKAIKTAATDTSPADSSVPPAGQQEAGFEAPQWSEPSPLASGAPELEVSAIVEGVVEERLSSFKKALEEVDTTLLELREQISNLDLSLKSVEENLQKKIDEANNRIGSLEERLDALEPRITALEKAFKDVVPSLVDSVREVNEMVKNLEEKKKRGLKDLNL